jgi:hypothetical protein
MFVPQQRKRVGNNWNVSLVSKKTTPEEVFGLEVLTDITRGEYAEKHDGT